MQYWNKYESSRQSCKHQYTSAVFLTADSWCPHEHCAMCRPSENNCKLNLDNFKQFVFQFHHENEKGRANCICFSMFLWKRKLRIQIKNLLNMKIVVNYLGLVFHVEVKAKCKNKILNFAFQFIKNTKWHFWYMDSFAQFLTKNILMV